MNPLFTLNTQNGSQLYAYTYLAAFLIGFIVLVIEGKRRNFPAIPWLLVILTSFLFFIIGTQAIRFSSDDWMHVIRLQSISHSVGRSALGGVLFAVLSVLCSRYIFKFRFSLLDAFAWAVPIGMFIQRAGCLIAGCCFGSPTNMPWGIQYSSGSHAYFHQVSNHLIVDSTPATLSIHPIAIYEMLGCAIIFFLIPTLRRSLKVSGNLFLSVIGLYLLVRFVTEFFRVGTFSLHFGLADFTITQVIVFHVIIVLLIIITRRENKITAKVSHSDFNISNKVVLLYSLVLSIIFLVTFRWLNQLEILTISLVLIPCMIFICWKVFKSLTVPGLRLTTCCLLVSTFLLTGQTLPERHERDSVKHSYSVLGIGTMTGSSHFVIDQSDCSSSQKFEIDETFKISGAGYSYVVEKKNGNVAQLGIGAYWGSIQEEAKDLQTPSTSTRSNVEIMAFNPYFQYDWKLFGMGLGLHVGNIGALKRPEYNANEKPSYLTEFSAFPSAYFRVGYVNKFFGEVRLAQQFPSPFPTATFQTNLGIGFGKQNGSAIRLGTSSYAGVFIAPSFPIGKHVLVESYLGFAPGALAHEFNNYSQENEQKDSFIGSLSLRYKFGNRHW